MNADTVLFYAYAAVAVAGAVGLVVARQLIHAVMALFATLFAVAALFLLAGSEFLAGMQLFVYGGAITVLVLFVLMLTGEGARAKDRESSHTPALVRILAVAASAGLFGSLMFAFGAAAWPSAGAVDVSTNALAETLFSRYLVPFEIAGLILTVALIGAVVIARDDDSPRTAADERPVVDGATTLAADPEGAGESA